MNINCRRKNMRSMNVKDCAVMQSQYCQISQVCLRWLSFDSTLYSAVLVVLFIRSAVTESGARLAPHCLYWQLSILRLATPCCSLLPLFLSILIPVPLSSSTGTRHTEINGSYPAWLESCEWGMFNTSLQWLGGMYTLLAYCITKRNDWRWLWFMIHYINFG